MLNARLYVSGYKMLNAMLCVAGFGLLEAGSVAQKNEVNILMKNAVDVVLGGLSYWITALDLEQVGSVAWAPSSWTPARRRWGVVFATFVFQLSFATTATTIVSGAMAERADFSAYCLFSFGNTITYCIPAGWVWGSHGFLNRMGVLDFAGSGAVHLTGGASALVAALMLGPRRGRFDPKGPPLQAGNPANLIVGTFILWWGWLVFNCGSTFGVKNHRWKYAGRAAINTLVASLGGGVVAIVVSFLKTKRYGVSDIVNGILGALVGVTAGSAFLTPRESLAVGAVGAWLVNEAPPLLNKIRVDDPVGAVAVHGMGGIWGLLAVGLFIEADRTLELSHGRSGLLRGGGGYLLGVQALAIVSIVLWSAGSTFLLLKAIDLVLPIRLAPEEEELGADYAEHGVRHEGYKYEEMLARMHRPRPSTDAPPRSQWDRLLLRAHLRTKAWEEIKKEDDGESCC
ncbi:amt-3, partial [Cordylochernes scorpioides]